MMGFRKNQQVEQIPVERIRPSPHQPRRTFDEESLKGLAASVSSHGVIQPLLVRRTGADYELIAGERRLRAAVMCGLVSVPCLVLQRDGEECAVLSLLENVQREDLSFLEHALALRDLLEQEGMTQSRLAELLGCSQPAVANALRVLKLPREELERLSRAGATGRHARALLVLERPEQRLPILKRIEEEQLTVRQTEALVQRALRRRPVSRRRGLVRDVRIFLNSLDRAASLMKESGIPVSVQRQEDGGDMIITVRVSGARRNGKSFVMEPLTKKAE